MEVLLGTYFSGDYWDGFSFQLKNKSDGSFPDITGYQVEAWFKRNPDASYPNLKTVSIGSGITILNVNGHIKVDGFELTGWQPGKVYFEVKLISPDSKRKTRVWGNFEVRW